MKPQQWAISIAVILTLAFSVTVTVVSRLELENDNETDMPCYRANANIINRTQPDQEQYCDTNTPCESGECYKFEDEETPICFEGDPCSRCPSGICNIGESYPMQVFCIEEQYCDANTPCESGECYKFEDEETPICFEGDPCSKCPSGMCNIGESYPMQLFCIDEQFCDANTPCESGECYKFEDKETPICFEGDPCSRCPSGKCNIAESYPMQVFCIDVDEVTTFTATWLIISVIAVGAVAVLVLSIKRIRIR